MMPVSGSALIWQQFSPPAAAQAACGGLSWLWMFVKAVSALTLVSASVNVVCPTVMPWKHGGAQGFWVTRLLSFRYLSDLRGGNGPHAATIKPRASRAAISCSAFLIYFDFL